MTTAKPFTHTPRPLQARGLDLAQLYPQESGTSRNVTLMRFENRNHAQLAIDTWGPQEVQVSAMTKITADQLEALARDFLDMAADLRAMEETAVAA